MLVEHEHGAGLLAIVGIWVSVEDQESLSNFICDLDPALPCAFVIQQHSTAGDSLQCDDLSDGTSLKVRLLNDGDRPQPGTLLLAPANAGVTFYAGQLRLTPGKSEDAYSWAHDFLRSLASDAGQRAIGVLLSEAGPRINATLHALRAAGGFAMIKLATALHDNGLSVAIEAENAGFIHEPSDMARLLARLGYLSEYDMNEHGAATRQLLEMIRTQCLIDFSNHEPTAVARRLHRRMAASGVSSHAQYLALVESRPEELNLLVQDLLVSATTFFRDPATFEALLPHVLEIFQRCLKQGRGARIWVAGCATGEEAYSIAMLFDEVWGNTWKPPSIQIFATDIDDHALAIARRGFYSSEALKGLAPERVQRYFQRGEGGYEVGKRLGDMVIFTRHQLISDPPFRRMDVVACRNVLIHFDAALQARVLKRFHFALQKQGVLVLGGSESVGQSDALFMPLNRSQRIFRKREESVSVAQTDRPQRLQETPRLPAPEKTVPYASRDRVTSTQELEATNQALQSSNVALVSLNEELNARSSALHQLNEEYTHLYDALDFPILVFDAEHHLLRFNAAAGRLFDLRATAIQQPFNRLDLPGMLVELESYLARATVHGEPEEAVLKTEGQVQQLKVTPGTNAQDKVVRLVVTLVDVTEVSRTQSALEASRSQLDTLMENTTLLLAMKDLSGKYLFANTSFLEAFGLSKADIHGRSDFELFPSTFAGDIWGCDLEALRGQKVIAAEHLLPGEPPRVFRTVHQVLRHRDGQPNVIITEAEDITLRKQAEGQLRIAAKVFEHAGEAIVVTDGSSCIQSVNNAFTRITGYSPEEALGRNLGQLLKSGETEQSFYEAMWKSLDSCGFWQGEIWNKRKDGELYPEWLTINRIEGGEEEDSANYVAVFADISSLKESQRQAEYLATHDALTGLPNRTLFHDRLDLAMAQARRHAAMVGLMFIDLDNFKSINDTLGHDMGDQLLVQVAERLRSNLRDLDTVARLGGDEFTLILTDAKLDTAEHLAHRIVEMLARPFQVRDHSLFVSSSIGLAFFPDDGDDASALIKAADTAMYRAKEKGRNRFELFKPELQQRLVQQARLTSAMREGLRQERFRLMFQPKYDTAEPPRIVGVEALLRWNDPELGEVSPAQFIPAAEATGLIQVIDRYVVQLAVQYISGWLAQGLAVVPVAMNISAYSFQEESFTGYLFERLKRYGVSHELIQVEITESTLVERTSAALGNIEKLREAGILLSIDDFGTGYSSLSYLKRLPLAELKIDKSFVDGLGGPDRNDEAIAQAILGMAAALGIRTVAEGVETPAQQAWLREHGCDYLQGYLLSRPLEAEDFSSYLLKTRN
ncbi:EAL domain-containing protein [Litchfieldella xinjiangensis]|uniref:EAL domain-containing protein n=1 Tax=Litchfieldella xinjiangensis TaxID=1166948 RepID=UPI0006931D25|nr:EAL domain-containing protein [Halomonas xinjiangensis]